MSRTAGRTVVIRRRNRVIVKETVIRDNLGNSRSVNDKPPGEVEIIYNKDSLKTKKVQQMGPLDR